MLNRTILGTAAIAALLAGPVMAESHEAADTDATTMQSTESTDATADADAADPAATEAETGAEETMTAEGAPELGEMVDVDIAEVAAETLTGARVYDQNDKWIGEVSEIIKGADGTASEAVIDVGGFLGIGEKPVALSFDDLSIKSAGEGEYTVYVALTEAELEALPSYEG